jgi:putative ABC transport system permease protein
VSQTPSGSSSYFTFSLRYAFRNLGRNRRRTLLTISAVLFSTAFAIIANRYGRAIFQLWEDGAADTGTAHAQAHANGYWQKQEGISVDLTLADGNELERAVRADSFVDGSVRRLKLEGIISAESESMYFLGIGVEPEGERVVSPRLFTKNDEGAWVSDQVPDGIVVGKGLAESLSLKLGDTVTLISQTVQGSANGIDGRIVGIVDAGIPSFSKRVVYTPLALLQKLIRMPARYTELAVRLKPGVDVETWVKVKQGLAEKSGIELRGWWEVEPIIRRIGTIWDSVVLVMTLLLFVSTALSVLNIIFMMVAERTVEIGTLMAIGARQGDVRLLVSLEALMIGLSGGGLGCALGNLAVALMDHFGVPFDSPFGTDKLIIHPKMSLVVTACVFVVGIVLCYVSAIGPSRKAASVEPVRAFRGQIT